MPVATAALDTSAAVNAEAPPTAAAHGLVTPLVKLTSSVPVAAKSALAGGVPEYTFVTELVHKPIVAAVTFIALAIASTSAIFIITAPNTCGILKLKAVTDSGVPIVAVSESRIAPPPPPDKLTVVSIIPT